MAEATRQAWEAAAAKALKGRAVEDLAWTTADGVRLRPLYAPDEVQATSAARRPVADAERPWDVRALVARRDPAEANAQALADLDGGAQSLLLVLDPAADGVTVASRDDLAPALEGVLLDLAPVALEAGFLGPRAADWLGELAKAAPRAPLAFHLDPISAFAAEGSSPGPMSAHLTQAAETAARLGSVYPEASLMRPSGRVAHEAGATDAEELGLALAAAVAYARALDTAGTPPAESLPRMVLGLSVDGQYFASIAKIRAARLLWRRLAEVLGAPTEIMIEVRSSRRTLTTLDPWTNLVRLGAGAFAGAVGGADAVVLEPFTQPLGAADSFAARQARNTQLVLMEEAGLGHVADPAAGSGFIEAHTLGLAEAGWAAFQEIEAAGGAVAALMSGEIAERTATSAGRLTAALAAGESAVVGVTRFTDATGRRPMTATEADRAGATPDLSLPGADDRCPALKPLRLAQPYEQEAA